MKGIVAAVLACIALIAFLVFNPLVIVGTGKRGVVTTWGAFDGKVLDEGIHWVTPVSDSVFKMDVQTQKLENEILAYSKDIQTVVTKLALNYHLNTDAVGILYQEVGRDYMERIIAPAIQESVKSATAKFIAQELIDQRPKVKEEIKTELQLRLQKYFVVDDFSITDFSFSDEYEKAVEEKQVAQQSALKASNDLDRIKKEAEQKVVQAEADARAIEIQAKAITQQGGAEYVNMKAVEKWNGVLPTQMIPGQTVPFINLK